MAADNGDGTVTFHPAPNVSGVTTFGYAIEDGAGGNALANVHVLVQPQNDAPVAVDDQADTAMGTPVVVPVLDNDSDPDGDLLTAILAGSPGKGQIELQPDGSFTYRANKKAKGTDSFTYLAQDTTGLSALETVSIQVKGKKKKKGKK
jgi:VCBS repeat-containing protein